jgi:uncharacterized protein
MFASDENVAVFGDFRYKSHPLGKVVSSPFSILMKVVDGKVTYLQFLEDSYATAASFREEGPWIVQTEAGTEPFRI